MTKRKNNIHLLSDEQRAAFGTYQKDLKKALPHMQAAAETAKMLRDNMINAKFWRIVDTPKPEDIEDAAAWSVGHAQVNYVEHIKTEGAQ